MLCYCLTEAIICILGILNLHKIFIQPFRLHTYGLKTEPTQSWPEPGKATSG